MAVDILRDLDLDHPPAGNKTLEGDLTAAQLENIRAYLACYYLITTYETRRDCHACPQAWMQR